MSILTRSDILGVLDMGEVIDAVEAAHVALATGAGIDLGPASIGVPNASTLALPMAAFLPHDVGGVKLLIDRPDNAGTGRPTQQSTILLVDSSTGAGVALLDGAAITRFRTAAASAVATKYLAREDASVLGLVGAGALARTHLDALRRVRRISRVHVWSRTAETAEAFRQYAFEAGVEALVADDPEEVVHASDILCTLTPSREPLVLGQWFRPGLHVNAVGAPPRDDHREIDTEGIRRARVIVDSRAMAAGKSGEVLIPLAEGAITLGHFADELGEVITGQKRGRVDADQVTLFNSIGIGAQDVATAHLVLQAAREKGVGTDVQLPS